MYTVKLHKLTSYNATTILLYAKFIKEYSKRGVPISGAISGMV